MPFSLLQTLRQVPVVVLDVETTGASAVFGDRITELGLVRYEDGRRVAEFQQLVNPQRRISPGVVALTGITPEMVRDQPTFSQIIDQAIPLLQQAVVVGHNVRFDLSFLDAELRRCGVDMLQRLENPPVLDTVLIARKRFGRGGNALQSLSRRLGIHPPVAHRALADALTTGELLQKLLEPVGGWNISLCDAYAQQGGPLGLRPPRTRQLMLPWELQEALEMGGEVLMEYMDARGYVTQRVIEPLEIRHHAGELKLIAHCRLRNDRRTFLIARIVRLSKVEPSMLDPFNA